MEASKDRNLAFLLAILLMQRHYFQKQNSILNHSKDLFHPVGAPI